MPQDIFSPPLYGRWLCRMTCFLSPSTGDGYASRHFLSTPLRETVVPPDIFSPPLYGSRLGLKTISLHPTTGDGYASWHFLSTPLREPSAFSRRAVVRYWRKYVHEVPVNRLGGLNLPRKSVVRSTDRPDMT